MVSTKKLNRMHSRVVNFIDFLCDLCAYIIQFIVFVDNCVFDPDAEQLDHTYKCCTKQLKSCIPYDKIPQNDFEKAEEMDKNYEYIRLELLKNYNYIFYNVLSCVGVLFVCTLSRVESELRSIISLINFGIMIILSINRIRLGRGHYRIEKRLSLMIENLKQS